MTDSSLFRSNAIVEIAAAGLLMVGVVPSLSATASAQTPLVSTFSIVAFDPANGDLGVVVQSKFPNVRPIVPWAKAGVGAVATQSFAELDYGNRGLELMAGGATAEEALRIILRTDPDREKRQVGIVDAKGNAATWRPWPGPSRRARESSRTDSWPPWSPGGSRGRIT